MPRPSWVCHHTERDCQRRQDNLRREAIPNPVDNRSRQERQSSAVIHGLIAGQVQEDARKHLADRLHRASQRTIVIQAVGAIQFQIECQGSGVAHKMLQRTKTDKSSN